MDAALEKYLDLQPQAVDVDTNTLLEARLALCEALENDAYLKISSIYGGKFGAKIYADSRQDVKKLLNEESDSKNHSETALTSMAGRTAADQTTDT